MKKEFELYITKNYYQLKSIAKKMTNDDDMSHELLHECIVQMYDKQNIVLKKYDDNSIRYYITAVLRTNWYSKTSPFHYKIRKERLKYVDLTTCMDIDKEQQTFEIQNLYDILEASYSELNIFQKSLMDLYLTLGSLKKVSQSTKIPLMSISRYINEAKKNIKDDIKRNLYEE